MKPISISEYWCTQNKKDFSAEIARHESQGWQIFEDFTTQGGRIVIMYLPQDQELENQAAFPTELKLSHSGQRGLTKQELVLKDFTAALITNSDDSDYHFKNILETAEAFTKQYFFTLKT